MHDADFQASGTGTQTRSARVQKRVTKGVNKLSDGVVRRVRWATGAEQILFRRMGSMRRRGVKSESSLFSLRMKRGFGVGVVVGAD